MAKRDFKSAARSFISQPISGISEATETERQYLQSATEQAEKASKTAAEVSEANIPAQRAEGPQQLKKGRYSETKSKRLQLLIQPSLLQDLRSAAEADGNSVNNLINSILVDYMNGHKEG